tara:strand:+ start:193 stop:333 length:141 start_codon:yes stop_codon:yes gene_type:complete
MERKSLFTSAYKKKKGKNPIPFPHFVLDKKKKFTFLSMMDSLQLLR